MIIQQQSNLSYFNTSVSSHVRQPSSEMMLHWVFLSRSCRQLRVFYGLNKTVVDRFTEEEKNIVWDHILTQWTAIIKSGVEAGLVCKIIVCWRDCMCGHVCIIAIFVQNDTFWQRSDTTLSSDNRGAAAVSPPHHHHLHQITQQNSHNMEPMNSLEIQERGQPSQWSDSHLNVPGSMLSWSLHPTHI